MLEIRIRNRVSEEEIQAKVGRRLLPEDVNLVLTGPCRVLSPEGKLLAVYLPASIGPELREQVYPTLHSLKNSYTSNRGLASASQRVAGASKRSYAMAVDSAIVGAFDRTGPKQFCRLTAWTGRETEKWRGLWPLFDRVSELFEQHAPEKFAVQAAEARKAAPEWVIPGTPFTTITVNNTYATGVHVDKGDLEEGFSTLVTFRNGEFKGGWLCFPEYRTAVDMQDGDLLLMDAHAWHGNTEFDPVPKRRTGGALDGDPGFERISVVSYFRTKMTLCGSAADEAERARMYAENRNAALLGE